LSSDNYLKYIFAYIHLNPIKLIQSKWKEEGIKNFSKAKFFLKNYLYSSYLDYADKNFNLSSKIINKEEYLKFLPKEIDLEKDLNQWLLTSVPKGLGDYTQ
jgi:hypothetical protein